LRFFVSGDSSHDIAFEACFVTHFALSDRRPLPTVPTFLRFFSAAEPKFFMPPHALPTVSETLEPAALATFPTLLRMPPLAYMGTPRSWPSLRWSIRARSRCFGSVGTTYSLWFVLPSPTIARAFETVLPEPTRIVGICSVP